MGDEKGTSTSAFFLNLKVPMLLGRKIKLIIKNNFIKIRTGRTCCGHPREPGCWQTLKKTPVGEERIKGER